MPWYVLMPKTLPWYVLMPENIFIISDYALVCFDAKEYFYIGDYHQVMGMFGIIMMVILDIKYLILNIICQILNIIILR